MLEKDIDHILFSEEQLKARVREIAGQIDRDFAGKEPMLISVLRGSFIFMADLMRSITLPCTCLLYTSPRHDRHVRNDIRGGSGVHRPKRQNGAVIHGQFSGVNFLKRN